MVKRERATRPTIQGNNYEPFTHVFCEYANVTLSLPGETDLMTSLLKPTNSLGTTSAQLAAVRLKSANKHIFRALLSLSSAALLVRMFGMLNQIVVSSRFGAGATMDAYFVVY